jgi:hypothetical protein
MTTAIARGLLHVQGWLYVATGLWPVVHLHSFEQVTGEKYDDFLVKTVGLLLFVIGVVLLRGLHLQRLSPELLWLAAGSAAALGVIDVVYYVNGRLWPVYLLDAAVETVFVIAALVGLRSARR